MQRAHWHRRCTATYLLLRELGRQLISCTAGSYAVALSLRVIRIIGVISMDRLLRFFLSQYIRRGAITFTTASGQQFTFGDGSGPPVSARFVTKAAQRRLLLDPELALGEIFMDGLLVTGAWHHCRPARHRLNQPDMAPRWAKLQWWLRYVLRHAQRFNPASAPATTLPITTIWTAGSTHCFWMPTSNIAAPISKDRTRPWTTPSSPRSATSRPRCSSKRPTRTRHRLRLGRAWALSGKR